ncbi:uncharacterized protein LOC113783642 [Coffea eugenioides]|uniref:uncharacterized protein LOC113783642 n=1 Tax=Coffea eugenioides TaxID=49369 RepID=UPI000F60DFE6|nr:uncharacterized protein LOC113783642 [Coffea eugenioides]
MVGCAVRLKKRKPEWLNTLLDSKFFGSCAAHHDLRKNEKNIFCIDCNLGLCKHCMSSSSPHCLHQWFQICKYVYHDVVRLQDIQKHLDCSKIQTYKINGEKAIHLNPRPQTKDIKIQKSKGGATCDACGRHIQDLPNNFCSIACKVSMVKEMSKEKNCRKTPISGFDNMCLKENEDEDQSISLSESSEVIQEGWISMLKPKKKLHKRKVFFPPVWCREKV